MIDGVKCSVGLNADLWRNNPLLNFELSVSESTGEILTQRKEAKVRSLRFILSPTNKGGFSCSFNGSLHKYKNINGINWDSFTFSQLHETLDNLQNDYHLELSNTFIHSLEIGVNIELDYSPAIIFKSVICHKGKAFDSIDRKNKRLGLICEYTDYAIKLYDKGYQNKIMDKYILRYELKLHRQRTLKPFDINTLADLRNVEKVTALLGLLLEKLNEIIFFDFSYSTKGLSPSKKMNWKQYSNPKYWESLNNKNYYKARQRYERLIEKYNPIDWQKFISKQVTIRWLELSEIKHKKGRCFPQHSKEFESNKKETFSNLEYLLENIALSDVQKRSEKIIHTDTGKDICYCISCGRQLTGQKKDSNFCSEKKFGKTAKKCRNKDSNRRLSLKRKIYKAMDKNLMIRITYQNNENEYSDILGANEISVTREWLDMVKSVEILEPQQQALKGKNAQGYLLTISETNNYEQRTKK